MSVCPLNNLAAFALALSMALSAAAQTSELPPVAAGASGQLSSGLAVFVREYRISGSTIFTHADFEPVLAPFVGRRVASEELIAVRNAVTRLYVERGYLSSGARIPDQDVGDGVVEIEVTEARLTDVVVQGEGQLRRNYLRDRLLEQRDRPLNIHELERRLQRLQRDERIRRVDAQLLPSRRPGGNRLLVSVEEASPWITTMNLANDASSALSAHRGGTTLGHLNVTGRGDSAVATFSRTRGLTELDARYAIPLNRHETKLGFRYLRSRGKIVEGPFEDLRLESNQVTYGVQLTHPVLRRETGELLLGLTGEVRRGDLTLDGPSFSFLPSTSQDDGESRLTVLRLFQQWTHRSENQAFAALLSTNWGLDLFDATTYTTHTAGVDVPDGRFVSWLAQVQWARRLGERFRDSELLLRANLQLTPDALLPLERMSVGGAYTVRGYHENELVRDNGVIASAELRIPIWTSAFGRNALQLAPFVDYGKAWNENRNASLESIASVGLGVRYAVSDRFFASLYWGQRLRDVERRDGDDLQNAGIHLRIETRPF